MYSVLSALLYIDCKWFYNNIVYNKVTDYYICLFFAWEIYANLRKFKRIAQTRGYQEGNEKLKDTHLSLQQFRRYRRTWNRNLIPNLTCFSKYSIALQRTLQTTLWPNCNNTTDFFRLERMPKIQSLYKTYNICSTLRKYFDACCSVDVTAWCQMNNRLFTQRMLQDSHPPVRPVNILLVLPPRMFINREDMRRDN